MDIDKIKQLEQPITKDTPGALLSGLWRQILWDRNYINKIIGLHHRYLARERAKPENKSKPKFDTSILGTRMSNNATADEMTWKTFIKLLGSLLFVKEFKLTVSFKDDFGLDSEHSILVRTSDYTEGDDDDNKEPDDTE